jgi:hypothetical protein
MTELRRTQQLILAGLASLVVVLILPAVAWGQDECPEGRVEVLIETPSGKVKILCMPAAAVDGLENAADHSQGAITPLTCPC